MSYTKEDLKDDINWLDGQGINRYEAEEFIISLIEKGFKMTRKEYVDLMVELK